MTSDFYNSKDKSLSVLLFLGFIFFLTRSFPFIQYSWIMGGFLCLCIMSFTKKIANGIYHYPVILIFLLALFINFIYSYIKGNDIAIIIRFYIIILFILCAYFCSYGTISIVKIFLYLMVLQAVIISIISIYMTKTYGIGDYSALRHYFLENDYGDVYTYGSGFYRVQIKGNALIPFAFMLHIVIKDYFYYRFKNTITVILAIGTIVAGNFAYFVSICLFFMYIILCSKSNSRYAKLRKIIFGVFLTVILPFFITYSIELIIMKSNGADSSLGVRWDQFTVLINDLTESVSNFVIGSGLGNVIKIQTPIRDYSAYIYYELQSVYFLNQLGVILFTLFLLINLLLTIKIIKYSELCVLYFLYVSYAITNPYILDSNHVAVIIVLVTLSNVLKKMKAK